VPWYGLTSRGDYKGAVGIFHGKQRGGVSFGLDVDCQEASSKTPCRAAQQQKTNTLPKGVLLDDFPGTAIVKREVERIF